MCLSLSYLFQCEGFSFTLCVGIAHLVFRFLSEEIFLHVASEVACREEGQFRILLHGHLELQLLAPGFLSFMS